MIDYSQNSEQGVILDYFGLHAKGMNTVNEPAKPGTLLDIGANDGATLSNSRALALLGWRGVLVEPSEVTFEKLRELYSASSEKWNEERYVATVIDGVNQWKWLVNAAITPTDGPIDFYDSGTHLKRGDTSLLSTTRPEEMARWKKSGETFTKTTVRGITFETLVKETGQSHFDFISIDAEGADLSILVQIDLTAVGCRMLCVETNGKNEPDFVAYAAKHGMKLHWRCAENLIFTRG